MEIRLLIVGSFVIQYTLSNRASLTKPHEDVYSGQGVVDGGWGVDN